MDLKDIKAIIDLMKKNSISEFELEKQDFKIKLKRGSYGGGSAIYEENATSALLAGPCSGCCGIFRCHDIAGHWCDGLRHERARAALA